MVAEWRAVFFFFRTEMIDYADLKVELEFYPCLVPSVH